MQAHPIGCCLALTPLVTDYTCHLDAAWAISKKRDRVIDQNREHRIQSLPAHLKQAPQTVIDMMHLYEVTVAVCCQVIVIHLRFLHKGHVLRMF